jgi:hypothetical protein
MKRSSHRRRGDELEAAIRRAFALLERHRHEAFLLAHSRRARERYEGAFLTAAIDRLERYLHVAEELTDSQAMRAWVEDVLAEESTERRHARRRRPVGSRARRKAMGRAGARFEAIASEVMAELEGALSQSPPEPAERPEERCVARTRRGTRCKNPAGPDGLCDLHARLVEASGLTALPTL